MPLDRWLLVPVLVLVSSSCSTSRTTRSLPPEPGDGPRLAEEVRLTAGPVTLTGKVTALRGDTVVFLPAPYWGEEPREYPLGRVTAVAVERAGQGGTGFVYGFVAGFTVMGARGASSAQYDEDYSSAFSGAVMLGLVTGLAGAAIAAGTRTLIYDLDGRSLEDRRTVLRRLMASDGEAPGTEEGSW